MTSAIQLHRLVLEDYDQLKKRKDEITKTIIDSTCAINDDSYKEVSIPPPPPSPPQATPLFLACFAGHSKAALLLLSKGADPNKAAKDGDGEVVTPLYHAVYLGLTEVVKSLLASGARQDLDTGGGELG